MLDETAWIQFINLNDPTIKRSLEVFKKGHLFPTKKIHAKT